MKYIDADKLKAEIERRKGICMAQIKANPGQTFPFIMEMTGYDKLLSFLSTLESEKPMNQDGLKKEIETQLAIFPYTKVSPELPESRFIIIQKELFLFARHFAQWGAEHLKK